ncbi:hypothetical protein FHL15_010117 [Xylaria flabelliformis]|uniref:Uncharacterized protein n=1 Tax=Xylaria flabelliformis TaxID=2512241 RepID=A0A553HM10_9PEZI|nr:hypothetical protein FHL15_010117 [Xylaria flabelliformis]
MVPVPIKSAEGPATASMPETATPYTRLHITPFDESLQNIVIPASVLPRARNISYHTIETFPEKRFGFVDLPTMDAEKLKKKLNGAVLKGSKVRVETARPESIPDLAAEADSGEIKEKKKKSKKRKREADVIEGVQLEGRKVKRGWTTTEQEMIEEKRKKAKKEKKEGKSSKDEEKKDKKDKKKDKKKATVKSKYTDEPECLFKTKLPTAGSSKATEEAEETSTPKKKRKRKSDREVVVHEFEKTTKYPTFLKASSTVATAEATTFEDGVGWVDSTGKVVEPAKSRRRPEGIPAPALPKPQKVVPTTQEDDDDDETSSSGSSSSDDDDDASSSGSESDSPDKQEAALATPKALKIETPALSSPSVLTKPESARPKSSGSITSLSIKIPPTTPAAKKVHPLEALYKRPQGGESTPNVGSEAKPFSFFGNGDDMEEDDDSLAPTSQAPMTPFTKQEFEFRNIRSAAPTPDTAHPSRSFNFWASQGSANGEEEENDAEGLEDVEEEEEQTTREPEDEDADVDMADGVASEQKSQTPASDFQKQFWESRGDLNRAWRKRRKSAAKEKRYRDNRARAERAI